MQVIETASKRPLKHKDLRSGGLSIRIGVLEGIVESWRAAGVRSVLADLIPPDFRRVATPEYGAQRFRAPWHAFRAQATRLVEESRPILHEVLVDCLFLAETQLVRLIKIAPGSPPSAEVDSLNGNSTARRIRDLDLDPDTQKVVMQSGKVGPYDRILAKIQSRCLDLSPYFYACDDDSGHHTLIAFFKKRLGDRAIWKSLANLSN